MSENTIIMSAKGCFFFHYFLLINTKPTVIWNVLWCTSCSSGNWHYKGFLSWFPCSIKCFSLSGPMCLYSWDISASRGQTERRPSPTVSHARDCLVSMFWPGSESCPLSGKRYWLFNRRRLYRRMPSVSAGALWDENKASQTVQEEANESERKMYSLCNLTNGSTFKTLRVSGEAVKPPGASVGCLTSAGINCVKQEVMVES